MRGVIEEEVTVWVAGIEFGVWGWELVSKKRKRRSIGKDRSTGSCVSNFAQTEQKMEKKKRCDAE